MLWMFRPRPMTLLVGESNDRDSFAVGGDVGHLINESFDRGGDSAHLGVDELKLALHALTKATAKNGDDGHVPKVSKPPSVREPAMRR